jgi:hypothetical protein
MPATQCFRLNSLTSEDEAREFIVWCCEQLGLCFHPDTHFSDYEERDGTKVFRKDAVELYEVLMEQAFQLLDDPCEVALAMAPFASSADEPVVVDA